MIMMMAQLAEIRENPWADISFLLCSSAITSEAIGIFIAVFPLLLSPLSYLLSAHTCVVFSPSLAPGLEDTEAEQCTGVRWCLVR